MKKCLYLLMCAPVMHGFSQTPEILWSYDMNDMAFGQAASADVDRDGLLEVCFSTYRNDGLLRMLNAEDGSELWVADAGGCADAAPLIYDVDMDGDLEVILAGSCDPTTYCFDADSGFVQWETPMRGSDSPPVAGDIDNDGKPEIIHGQFGGYVLCLNGEDGSVVWELEVDPDSWIQTEPALLDVNFDGQLDFVVATWSFYDNHKIFCYQGDNAELIWENDAPEDVIYHGVSFGDMDNDDTVELVIGDYAGILHCFNAFNGEVKWQYQFPANSLYIGGPTSMGDLNDDGYLEVVFNDWFQVGCLDHLGNLLWDYSIPDYGQAFRGMALSDINGDEFPDVTFCSKEGTVIALAGESGEFIQSIDLQADFGDVFEVEHGPLIADFNDDGVLDVFAAGGYAEYPAIENNYGRVYMVSWGEGNGPDWKMFRRDHHRSACLCNDSLLVEEEPVSTIDVPAAFHEFSVYPNPFSSYLAIQIPEANGMVTINLYATDGSLIFTENKMSQGDFYFTLPGAVLQNLSDGMYLIQVESQGRSERFTLVHTQP